MVIVYCNFVLVFYSAKHYLYFVELFIKFFVVWDSIFTVAFAKDTGSYAFVQQGIAKACRAYWAAGRT